MTDQMANPVEATEPAPPKETQLGKSLRERACDDGHPLPDDLFVRVACSELRSLADAFDAQQHSLDLSRRLTEELKQEFALRTQIIETRQDRMRLIIRLMRFYALNPVILPDQDEVIAFLRAYIDDGKYTAVPWPTDLPTAAKFLSDAGYFNLNGVAHRAHAIKE